MIATSPSLSSIACCLSESARVTLQTNELVAATRDSDYRELCDALNRMKLGSGEWKNRLIYGDRWRASMV